MESNMDFPKRQGWDRPLEFLFAIIGYSVGKGAFILAYLIMWTFCGVPLLYMELAIGQYTRLGPLGAMEKLCPLFKGAAAGSVVVVAISRTLYMVIIVWPFYYLFNSFNQEFPWSRCGHDWNTQYCVDTKDIAVNFSYHLKKANMTNINSIMVNKTTTASAEYFRVHVLQITSGIDDFGTVRWEFALILLFTWILIYFSAFKGTKSVGKVVYVTVLFPYIVLILMIIRGFTLPGSYEGLLFLFTPKWYRLTEPQVWIHAAATNFFSLGIGGGGNITLASFRKPKEQILKYTLFIAIVDLFSSLLACMAIFSNLGYLARTHGKPFEKVVTSGIELVFIVFPEIFTTMPLSQLMSVLFFLMIITLAFDTMLVGPEICVTAITDRFKKLPRKEILYAIACILFYCLGLPTIAQGGIYYFALLDYYLSFGSSVSLAFFEIVAVSWFYGARSLAKKIYDMTGSAPHCSIVLCWYIISPLLLVAIWVFSTIKYSPFSFGSYSYPTWAVVMAWVIASLPLICIPIGMAHALYRTSSISLVKRLRLTVTPTEDDSVHGNRNLELKVI